MIWLPSRDEFQRIEEKWEKLLGKETETTVEDIELFNFDELE